MASPSEYMDLILVPSILHIDPLAFHEYPPALKGRIRNMVMYHIAGGHALNTQIIARENHSA